MASIAECELAFQQLADKLASADPTARKKTPYERTISCTLTDLDSTFAGRLHNGQLVDIRQVNTRDAQVRMSLQSDDLLELATGTLRMSSAWAKGRVKIEASVLDLLRLRTLF